MQRAACWEGQKGGEKEREEESCVWAFNVLQSCLIEGCFNAVGGWQVGIIIAICLRSRHHRLTFNGCSLCSVSKCPGEFDFHYCLENIHSAPLLSSLGLHEDDGFCINDEVAV